MSSDGAFIAGYVTDGGAEKACRWDWNGTTYVLNILSGATSGSYALGVSASGTVVGVGGGAFIWDDVNGYRNLQSVLVGYGVDMTGWSLSQASAISADGRTIVGLGTHNGLTEGFVATIPEPGTFAALAMGMASIGGMLIRRRRS